MLNKKDSLIDDYEEEVQIDEPISKGKKILFLLVPLVIAVIGAAIYAIVHFMKSEEVSDKKQTQAYSAVQTEYAFVDMDDIIVTLASSSSKKNFLKISLSLQVKNKDIAQVVTTKLPIIKDSFQLFLRELRPGDLSGSAGVLMLKNELLKRINKIVAPEEVMDVLFKEILLS